MVDKLALFILIHISAPDFWFKSNTLCSFCFASTKKEVQVFSQCLKLQPCDVTWIEYGNIVLKIRDLEVSNAYIGCIMGNI